MDKIASHPNYPSITISDKNMPPIANLYSTIKLALKASPVLINYINICFVNCTIPVDFILVTVI